MGVKFIKSNINPFVPGCLVDWVTIPGPNLPTLFVCHQLGFCITIPPALLQVLAIPLCQHHGGEGQSGRPVLVCHVFHVR